MPDWLIVVLFIAWCAWPWYFILRQEPRPKPPGYIGRFQRLDGRVLHVARLDDGTLMVASEEPPGVMPKDLGTVTGPELLKWIKLAITPDGNDAVIRPWQRRA